MPDTLAALTPPPIEHGWLAARTPLDKLRVFLVVAVLYYLLGRLALLLLSDSGVAVFWPASGLAAGAIVAMGRDARWPIALAVAAATIVANLQARSSVPMIAVFSLCNGLECLLFGALMRMLDRQRLQLESLRSVAAFLAAAAVATAVAAAPAALAIQLASAAAPHFLQIWLTWLRSDWLGIVVLAPMLITLPAVLHKPPRNVVLIEGGLGVLLATVAAYFAFDLAYRGLISLTTPMSLLFPFFLWLAARTPALFSATGIFLVSVVIVEEALAGGGVLGTATVPLAERLAAAHVALVTTSCAVLTLTSMFAQVNNAVEALRSSERRLRLALAAGNMYAFDNDLVRGTVLRVGGLTNRLGLSPQGTMSQWLGIVCPGDLAKFKAHLERQSAAEPTINCQVRMRAADGQELTIDYRSEAEYSSSGNRILVRGVCVDVTELEQARVKLEVQAEQLQSALAAGRVFVFEYDYRMRSVRRSDNAAGILGVPRELARSSRNLILELAHPEDRDRLKAYGLRVPDEAYKSGTFRINRPDGRVAWLEVQSTATFDAEGRMIGMSGLARDVTERERASQRHIMLIRELDHRVKNALARMAVVVKLSRDRHQTLDDYISVIQGRIGSMARTQERLSSNRWEGIGIVTLIDGELAPYRKGDNCRMEGPDQVLEPDTAQALAFTVHELATNAAKHGALARPTGTVEVTWTVSAPAQGGTPVLRLAWRELADGGIIVPQRESYGLNTIRNLLRYEQGADVRVDFTPTGLHCDIELALPDPSAGPGTGPFGLTHAEPHTEPHKNAPV